MKKIFLTHVLSILVLTSTYTQASDINREALDGDDKSATTQRTVSPPVDKNLLRVLESYFLNKGTNSVAGAKAKALAQYKNLVKFGEDRAHLYRNFPQQPNLISKKEH